MKRGICREGLTIMAGFHRGGWAIAVLGVMTGTALVQAQPPNLRLQNDDYVVEVSPENGLIRRIHDKRGRLELLQETRLADNFTFSLPLPGKAAWQATEANYILGKDQRLTSYEVNAASLVLKWGPPLTSVFGRPYCAAAVMTIELVRGEIRFTFRIENSTQFEIGEVYYPILGGSLGLGETPDVRKKTELVLPMSYEVRKERIYQIFANFSWLGVLGPEQFYAYPDGLCMPWMEFNHPMLHRSVYFGAHDPVARYKVLRLEMLPGTAGGRSEGNWPKPEELKGLPAGVKLCLVQFPYQPPAREYEAAPVVLRFHDGDWHEGARIYGHWLRSQCDLARPRRDWLYHTQAFQEARGVHFKDLPEWARQGAAVGVKGLLLTEWKLGGRGNGLPRFEPDPRWGSREELAASLRKCHALGVRVAVLVNVQPANQLDGWYRTELQRYACRDRWGIIYTVLGWHGGSPLTGGYGGGERRAWLNPGHPGMRRVLVTQLRELAAMGVDGVHLQDFFARALDFNSTCGKTADRASWEGGIECVKEIVGACRTVRPEFSVTTDTVWDRMLAVTQTGSIQAGHSCPLRTAFPSWQPTFTLDGGDSLRAINDALRYRGRLRIAPSNGEPMGGSDLKGIVGYVKAALAVREALSQTLLDGELLGEEALATDRPVARSVFRNKASGLRTAVLVNPGVGAVELGVTGFASPSGRPTLLWQPSEGVRRAKLPLRVRIPRRQIAVITEEAALDRLTGIPRWEAPAQEGRVIFELESADDLQGWTLEGAAFGVHPLPGLCPKPTLNSLARSGEAATGSALSPPFEVGTQFDRMEIVFQGGWSRKAGNEENLALRLIDAKTGALLEEILPPGTHELTTRRITLEGLKGRSIRLQLVDRNTASSFAWIGLREVRLIRPQARRPGE